MKIGVFDSGIGGKAIAETIESAMPQHTICYVQDSKNVPYGTKSPQILLSLVLPILQQLVDEAQVDVIVIACNTVTTTIITELRSELSVPLIGIEPMIKPAAELTHSNVIAVCATPTTLASKRYEELVETYAAHLEIIEPDCSQWAYMIEQNNIDTMLIEQQIDDICKKGADVIVLGCTHYHWIEAQIKKIADRYGAAVIQPEQAIVRRLKTVLEQLG